MQTLNRLTRAPLLSRVPNLTHGFTNKEISKAEADVLDVQVATAKQIHTAELAWVERLEKRVRDADAVATFTPGLAVGVYSADCTPLLVAALDESTSKVYAAMAIHGGWRGTALGIAGKSFREFAGAALSRRPGTPTRFLAAIGPCISFDSFEVGEDVIQAFPDAQSRGLARFLRKENERPKYLLDLPGENQRQLREAATSLHVPLEIDSLGLCTLKLETRFPSYRRDRERAGRILSFLAFAG